jgi:MYXO-CTERM domain-containing protein
VVCDDGYSCVLGVCSSCECTACSGGKVCSQNVCVDSGCDQVSCNAGQHCSASACVDDCQGATCPTGQICEAGACKADPNAVPIGDGEPGGIEDPLANAGTLNGGVIGNGSMSGSGSGGSRSAGATPGDVAASGCGCRVPLRESRAGWLAAIAVLALAARRRRRHQ